MDTEDERGGQLDKGARIDDRILAYRVSDTPPVIRKAERQRQWMDETQERFAYRCLPLVIGNQAGWDLLNPVALRTKWNGGGRPTDVLVERLPGALDDANPWAEAHFGQGVLTFSVGYLFRTPPGIGLLVCGPPNLPKDGLYPLTGIVETDWSHATFTMNYRFTRPHHWVEFAEGEPFCRIIPVDRRLLEGLRGEVLSIDEDPQLKADHTEWARQRAAFNQAQKNPFSPESRQGWQRDYFQGRLPTGEKVSDHQTQLRHGDFINAPLAGAPAAPARAKPSAGRKKLTVNQFLWEDQDIYTQRFEKSAEVLAGLAQALAARRPLGGAERGFLESFERVRSWPAEDFSDVWREPQAFHWAGLAFQLADAVMNDNPLTPLAAGYIEALEVKEASNALALHLDRFRLFELGRALRQGLVLAWENPLRIRPPLAIPATAWTITASGPLELLGGGSDHIRFARNGRTLEAPLKDGRYEAMDFQLRLSPVLRSGDCALRIQPEVLAGIGLEEASPTLSTPFEYRQRMVPTITHALEAIARYTPESFAELAEEISVLAPKPAGTGEFQNTTFSAVPGAMIISVVDHPLELADRIVHELFHNRLFCIENRGGLLDTTASEAARAPRHYSPWRQDPRPFRGILHGLYVFIAVGRFWLRVLEANDLAEADRDYAVARILRIAGQVEIARDLLAVNAPFTPFGTGVFDGLRDDVRALRSEVERTGIPDDAPALLVADDGRVIPEISRRSNEPMTVKEALREHRELYDRGLGGASRT